MGSSWNRTIHSLFDRAQRAEQEYAKKKNLGKHLEYNDGHLKLTGWDMGMHWSKS